MNADIGAAVERARADANYGFDTLRDELAALPESALPELLEATKNPTFADVRGQLVAALSDTGWPGAFEDFVVWAGGEDVWIALDSGCALAAAGGGDFDFWGRVAPGDQPDPALVKDVVPELLAWWTESGASAAPSIDVWREGLGRPPSREERIYALVRSGDWAVLSNGLVLESPGVLPRGSGTHYSGGMVTVDGVGEVAVAFVLDSDVDDPIVGVMVESQQGWINIAARAKEPRPRHTIGDIAIDPEQVRYEVGPTGSLRERAAS